MNHESVPLTAANVKGWGCGAQTCSLPVLQTNLSPGLRRVAEHSVRKPAASLEQQKRNKQTKKVQNTRAESTHLACHSTRRNASHQPSNPFGTFSEVRKTKNKNTRTSVAVPAGKHHDKQVSQGST